MAQNKIYKDTARLIRKQIEEAKLPKTIKTTVGGKPITKFAYVDGSKLTAADMADGSTPVAGMAYRVREFIFEDHYENALVEYKKNGWEGVGNYIKAVQALREMKSQTAKHNSKKWWQFWK